MEWLRQLRHLEPGVYVEIDQRRSIMVEQQLPWPPAGAAAFSYADIESVPFFLLVAWQLLEGGLVVDASRFRIQHSAAEQAELSNSAYKRSTGAFPLLVRHCSFSAIRRTSCVRGCQLASGWMSSETDDHSGNGGGFPLREKPKGIVLAAKLDALPERAYDVLDIIVISHRLGEPCRELPAPLPAQQLLQPVRANLRRSVLRNVLNDALEERAAGLSVDCVLALLEAIFYQTHNRLIQLIPSERGRVIQENLDPRIVAKVWMMSRHASSV